MQDSTKLALCDYGIGDGYDVVTNVKWEDGSAEIIYRPLVGWYRARFLERLNIAANDGEMEAWDCVHDMLAEQVKYQFRSIPEDIWFNVAEEVMWLEHDAMFKESRRNLAEGVELELRNPEVANLDCNHCKQYIPSSRGDIERPEGYPVPCETSIGCPKGHWKEPRGLTEQNRQAYNHFMHCNALQSWPNDAMVACNAACIRAVYSRVGVAL
jgi:hypothetical protein